MRTRFEDHAVGSLQVCCLYKINLPFLFFFGGRYFLNGIINHEYNYIMKETFIGSIIGKKNVFLQVWLYTLWPNGNWTCLNCTCSFPITNHMLAVVNFSNETSLCSAWNHGRLRLVKSMHWCKWLMFVDCALGLASHNFVVFCSRLVFVDRFVCPSPFFAEGAIGGYVFYVFALKWPGP